MQIKIVNKYNKLSSCIVNTKPFEILMEVQHVVSTENIAAVALKTAFGKE